MSKFRRRLMMATLANNTSSNNDEYVTWEYFFQKVPKGVFIRKEDDNLPLYRDTTIITDYVTWHDLYEIVPPGLQFVLSEREVQVQYYTEAFSYPHTNAYVTYADLRKIFPYGVKVQSLDGETYVINYSDMGEDKETNVNRFVNFLDVYGIIPKGISLLYRKGKLYIGRDDTINIQNVNVQDLSDVTLPTIYKHVDLQGYVRLRDLYQIIPSGVKISKVNDVPTISYDASYDYDNQQKLTLNDFYSIFPYDKKLSYKGDEIYIESATSLITGEVTGEELLTWGMVRHHIDKGIHVVKMSNQTYTCKLDNMTKFTEEGNITHRELSRIIPFGMKLVITDSITYQITANGMVLKESDYSKPITKSMLDNIIQDNITFSVDEYNYITMQ